jgi:DivIVA domain-containing protein
MGVDQTSLDRIRNATFPSARRGYDKHEVEKFLARLADWLETGAGDEDRSDTVKRELERVGQRTGAILSQAEDSAQQIRAEAEEEARGTINTANSQAEETRSQADAYSSQTRAVAERYAEEARQAAQNDAAADRAKAEEDARETIEQAQAQAGRIVDEGTQRREDIEAVIADLLRRRDDVLTDTEELSGKLTAAVSEHRPATGSDPFSKPNELDPLERDDGAAELEDHAEPEEDMVDAEAGEPDDEAAEDVERGSARSREDPTAPAHSPGPGLRT